MGSVTSQPPGVEVLAFSGVVDTTVGRLADIARPLGGLSVNGCPHCVGPSMLALFSLLLLAGTGCKPPDDCTAVRLHFAPGILSSVIVSRRQLGSRQIGSLQTVRWRLENPTPEPIIFSEIRKSCACHDIFVARPGDVARGKLFVPGAGSTTVLVRATVMTRGANDACVRLLGDRGRVLELHVDSLGMADVFAMPHSVELGTVASGETACVRFRVLSDRVGFALPKPTRKGVCGASDVEWNDDANGYEITETVTVPQVEGLFEVKLPYQVGDHSVVVVCSGNVEPPYRVEPSGVLPLGIISRQVPLSLPVRFFPKSPADDLEVESARLVDATCPRELISLQKTHAGGVSQVVVGVSSGGLEPGPFHGAVEVQLRVGDRIYQKMLRFIGYCKNP